MAQRKGHFSQRGVPDIYDEVKKAVKMTLTPTAITLLDEMAEKCNTSRSEFVEQVARGVIKVELPNSNESDSSDRSTETKNTSTVDQAA